MASLGRGGGTHFTYCLWGNGSGKALEETWKGRASRSTSAFAPAKHNFYSDDHVSLSRENARTSHMH